MLFASASFDPASVEPLAELLGGRKVVVLSGAGCSTESGIPDYRGPQGSLRSRKPIQYKEFVESENARIRYWARSSVGWPRVAGARANAAHRALARMEEIGTVVGLITQNVDGLHQQAGTRRIVELHGTLAWVRCLVCNERFSRAAFQDRLLKRNPHWAEWMEKRQIEYGIGIAPDGDADVPASALATFRVPGCEACGSVLKPDVVFFGESVPATWVDRAWNLYEEADVLLVVGSSLTVYSGRRFIYRADREGVPIAVVNLGPTRADESAAVKVEGQLGAVLPHLASLLSERVGLPPDLRQIEA